VYYSGRTFQLSNLAQGEPFTGHYLAGGEDQYFHGRILDDHVEAQFIVRAADTKLEIYGNRAEIHVRHYYGDSDTVITTRPTRVTSRFSLHQAGLEVKGVLNCAPEQDGHRTDFSWDGRFWGQSARGGGSLFLDRSGAVLDKNEIFIGSWAEISMPRQTVLEGWTPGRHYQIDLGPVDLSVFGGLVPGLDVSGRSAPTRLTLSVDKDGWSLPFSIKTSVAQGRWRGFLPATCPPR